MTKTQAKAGVSSDVQSSTSKKDAQAKTKRKSTTTTAASAVSATSTEESSKKTKAAKTAKTKETATKEATKPVKTAKSSGKDNAAGNSAETKSTTQKYRHVDYEHQRPVLTKEGNRKSGVTGDFANRTFDASRKDKNATLRIIPLGGLDAIGKNMTVFECKDDLIVDDAGLMFPDDNHPGIDLVLPDYTYILDNADKLRGIIITHGHEDHTGSLPYLLKDLDREVPIYGTKLTLGLIEGKLAEHKIKNAKLIEIHSGESVNLGCFTASFFSVNHSIPDSVGIFLQSPAGNVMHTGDFKLDQTPIDGVHTDFASITRYGSMGVDLLMSDSTNAQVTTFTPSEAEVGKALNDIIGKAKGRVLVASFSSHIHRMQQICDAAVANGRKVVVTGRSMIQNTDIARRLGYLHIDDSDIIDAYDMKSMPANQVVVMCTGSQGEPLSALARIASGNHRTIQIEQGDTVIISATPVPGNEKAVTKVINILAKLGADVFDKRRAQVHVSGHAGAEELKIMLCMVKPRAFLPVHGEAAHLRAHAGLAKAVGVPEDQIFILENGDTLELSTKGVRKGEPVQSGVVYVDGLSVGDTTQTVLDDRSSLSAQGFAAISAAFNRRTASVKGEVQLEMRGITGGDDMYLLHECEQVLTGALGRGLAKECDLPALKKIMKDSLLSFLWDRIQQRPMVVVHLIEV